MLRRIVIKGFRALRYVSVDLDDFQVLVGPNASGKSTFFDAINLVRDVLSAGIERSIYGDLRLSVPQRAVDPQDLSWMRSGDDIEIQLWVELPERVRATTNSPYAYCCYELALTLSPQLSLRNETLWLLPASAFPAERDSRKGQLTFPGPVFPHDSILISAARKTPPGWRKVVTKIGDTGNDYFKAETSDWNNLFRLGPTKVALANLPEDESKFPIATWFKRFMMDGVQRLVLNAEGMRLPCRPGLPATFLPDGSNIAWVVHRLEQHLPDTLKDWLEHVRTALPDLTHISTREREEDRSRYIVLRYASGLEAPSWLVSEGTLRLLALTLLAYAPDAPRLMVVEEPENGIHPQAIEIVFESLSGIRDRQVLCASHSPVMLSLARTSQLLCFAKTDEGATDIIRGNRHPRLREWQDTMILGDLFAAGILS